MGRAVSATRPASRAAPDFERIFCGKVLAVLYIVSSLRNCSGCCDKPTPWADTTTAHGRLMLTVLGGLAEFERDLIRARTSEGRERAKARGVKLGRKPKLTPHQQQEVRRRKQSGEAIRDIARSYNVHNSTISRLR